MEDVTSFMTYMMGVFKNRKAARDFLNNYEKQLDTLKVFPFGYRGVSFGY